MRYLSEQQLRSHLNLQRAIEQWLIPSNENDYTVLKWTRIDREHDGNFTVAYFECFDEGNEEYLDVYGFSVVDPDEPFGVINTFSSIDKALSFATTNYGTSNGRYISKGMIQEEYLNYLRQKVN